MERWFRELTDKALRRGVFHSVPDLVASIQEYIDAHNNDPKPYVWTATAWSILAKVARGRQRPRKSQLNTGHGDLAARSDPQGADRGGSGRPAVGGRGAGGTHPRR